MSATTTDGAAPDLAALTARIADLDRSHQEVLAELRRIGAGVDYVVERLPEEELYCPRETIATFKQRRRGEVKGPAEQVLCEGGLRLGRPTRHGDSDPAKRRDQFTHPLPHADRFTGEFGDAIYRVKSHNVWRQHVLSREGALAAGLTLREGAIALAPSGGSPAGKPRGNGAAQQPRNGNGRPRQQAARGNGTAQQPRNGRASQAAPVAPAAEGATRGTQPPAAFLTHVRSQRQGPGGGLLLEAEMLATIEVRSWDAAIERWGDWQAIYRELAARWQTAAEGAAR